MKKFFILTVVLLIFFLPLKAHAGYEEEINQIARDNNISAQTVDELTVEGIIQYVYDSVREKAARPVKTFLKLSAVIALCCVAKAFVPDEKNTASLITESVGTVIIFISLLEPMQDIIYMVSDNLRSVKNFMATFLPLFSAICMASGEFLTSNIYTGFFLAGLVFAANFCLVYILPSVRLYFALIISNAISPYIRLESIGNLYLKFTKRAMRCIVSVICFVLTLQTTISRGKDTLAVKTGKLIAGSAVPVIGNILQDAIGSVYSGMEAIKGFAGVVGILAVVYIFLPSVVVLAIYWLTVNCLAAVADIFGTKPISECVKGFVNVIELTLSVVFLFMTMLVLSLTVMISLTNGV